MSYKDGWAAVNLEMPKRIPHEEFDAEMHWELVKAVTGISVGPASSDEARSNARRAFVRAWNYDFMIGTMLHVDEFGPIRTNMGHAVYAAGGVDYSNKLDCLFATPEEALKFDPWEAYGRKDKNELIRRFEEHYRRGIEFCPEAVQTTGTYITLLTAMIYIFGWDMLLLAAGTDPKKFGEVVNRYAGWMQQYYDAIAETSVPVICSHDDIVWTSGAIFRPEWYRTYIFPNLKKLYAPVIESGKKVIFVSDGNYTEFIDDIAACGVRGFFLEPLTDLKYMAERYGKTHVMIGNADTRVLLYGTKPQIRAEVERCMSIGRNCPGFFMGVTNMIPPNTPVDNALYYYKCYEELSRR